MRLEFDIYEFLRRQLPHHKRQTNRLALFNWPIAQLSSLWNAFAIWRSEMIYESNITGQKLALVNLLNRRVTGAANQISISEKDYGGIYLSYLSEATDYVFLSTLAEASDLAEIPLDGETATDMTADFTVYVPAGVNIDQVAKIVDRYVIAGFDYEIQQS